MPMSMPSCTQILIHPVKNAVHYFLFAYFPGCLPACLPACLLACLLACLPACPLACLLACLPVSAIEIDQSKDKLFPLPSWPLGLKPGKEEDEEEEEEEDHSGEMQVICYLLCAATVLDLGY
jgi:hypothetical protein